MRDGGQGEGEREAVWRRVRESVRRCGGGIEAGKGEEHGQGEGQRLGK